jgi:hypothetical protein
VGHRVGIRVTGLDTRVLDTPGVGRGPDLVVRSGEGREPVRQEADVFAQPRRRVACGIDRHENRADARTERVHHESDRADRYRADVRAVGVAEEDEDRLATERFQGHGSVILVRQLEWRCFPGSGEEIRREIDRRRGSRCRCGGGRVGGRGRRRSTGRFRDDTSHHANDEDNRKDHDQPEPPV